MTQSDAERYRVLKKTYQQLYRKWKRDKGLCIVCAEREGIGKDHLPPKVLFPASLRTPKTEFFTFPACKQCNGSSSDEDFLFSVALSFGLNQDAIRTGQEPTDPDLLALQQQTLEHFSDPQKTDHRTRLLKPFVETDPQGRSAIDLTRLPLNQTLTKIAKSIYWLNTGGDILQQHDPAWWIRSGVDTSKPHFFEKHLKTSQAELHWGDRFIPHFTIGHPENGVGGFIMCSLNFYTNRAVGQGMSWLVVAAPVKTLVNGRSLHEWATSTYGKATIERRKNGGRT